ncbi:UDP-N-acetylmuramate--alanine ligase [Allosphingosinicella flava]|uniref:UDP-N-acetylmuramate--alanine ligase n=1 Tax=Allosphingosinicella flava TaxID=2771430 RepID=A0A7T2LLP7_9SPHN|nr:Mur ligase family protein [Sphingosinicella flava]QPQ54247.1 UDP-N-acetylmuramate--alanine ligase [Sphingosinicella flava]
MTRANSYFFCGIGGSGMLPLATILRAQGHAVAGSDRSLDQGRLGGKFAFLEAQGIGLYPQDGSGVTSADQILVTSAAIEETVPDVAAARAVGARRMTRPQLLAQLFNAAETGIAVGGTSGKSTVTGMIGWILHALGRDPTVMNGAVMKNFAQGDTPFASALTGSGDVFVSEVDESDGSIALYRPAVAVLNNITLDHKSMDELRGLFLDFVLKADRAVLNRDDPETAMIAASIPDGRVKTYSLSEAGADLHAANIREGRFAISFDATLTDTRETVHVALQVPGRHNASNALAAMLAVHAAGVPLAEAAHALAGFQGLKRRFEQVGEKNGIGVIDDFGHNPDKIAATLATLHAFPGRLLLFFQPHGYGPLKVMGDALIDTFASRMTAEDRLILTDPVYFGGTVDRSVGSADIVAGIAARGARAEHVPDREAAGDRIAALARPGDRIVVMGARDDTLSAFAAGLLDRL